MISSPARLRSCSFGTLLLGLQLAVSTPPAWAAVAVDRIVFEAHLLTATTAPEPPSVPQPTPDDTPAPAASPLLGDIAALNERIALLEESGGVFAPGLVQEYLDLGRRYQSLGQHESAIEVFADAEYISRITAGFINPDLLVIMEASLPSLLARGELQEFGQKQQSLSALARELYGNGSSELVPMLTRLGDWQVTSFRRSVQRQPVVSISFGGSGSSPNPRRASFGNLFRAQLHYEEAISNLLQRQDLNADTLLPLEYKYIQTLYLQANRNGLLDDPDFFLNGRRSGTGSRVQHSELQGFTASFVNGRSAYQRMRIYARLRQQPIAEQAGLLIAEADWHLVFKHHATARRLYQEARMLLQSQGATSEDMAALLTPALPLQLPLFMPLPHSRSHFGLEADEPLEWQGWIDVSFELSRYGKPTQLKLLGSSDGPGKRVQQRLRRLMMGSPFRPRIGPQEESPAPHVYRLRYYYAQVGTATGSQAGNDP